MLDRPSQVGLASPNFGSLLYPMLQGFAQWKAARASFCSLDFHLYFIIMVDDAGVLLAGLLVRRRKERDFSLVLGSPLRGNRETTTSMQTSLLPQKPRQASRIETPSTNPCWPRQRCRLNHGSGRRRPGPVVNRRRIAAQFSATGSRSPLTAPAEWVLPASFLTACGCGFRAKGADLPTR